MIARYTEVQLATVYIAYIQDRDFALPPALHYLYLVWPKIAHLSQLRCLGSLLNIIQDFFLAITENVEHVQVVEALRIICRENFEKIMQSSEHQTKCEHKANRFATALQDKSTHQAKPSSAERTRIIVWGDLQQLYASNASGHPIASTTGVSKRSTCEGVIRAVS